MTPPITPPITLPPSTIQAAVRTAERSVSVYKQGAGYVVSTFDEHVKAWRTSDPMPWPVAIERKRVAVTARALQRLGMDLSEAFAAASSSSNLRQRPEDNVSKVMA